MNQSLAKMPSALIVDDSPTTSALLRSFLSSAGYTVLGELANGKHLMENIAAKQPDIICLDYNLPGYSGLDLLKTIKENYPKVAVVMVTGTTDPKVELIAAELGVDGFIRKPFSESVVRIHLDLVFKALSAQKNAKPPSAKRPEGPTAIIADDSSTMRAMLATIITGNGIHLYGEAENGIEAVELAIKHKPHIVCLDVEMPSMNGLQACKIIREKSPASKIVMITANATREVVAQASKSGANGFIVKPFDPDKAMTALTKLLSV